MVGYGTTKYGLSTFEHRSCACFVMENTTFYVSISFSSMSETFVEVQIYGSTNDHNIKWKENKTLTNSLQGLYYQLSWSTDGRTFFNSDSQF